MANIEGAIRAFVLSSGTVSGLISTRFYYLTAGQEESLPYVVYQDISDPVMAQSFDDISTRQPRFQFDVYASSSTSMVAVRQALIDRLRWMSGTVGSVIASVVQIANVQSMKTEETQVFRSIIDAIFEYQEG